MWDYFVLLIGFVLLIKGADFFVDGASALARLLRVPSFLIGLTIVAMGTSAPEAAVSISAGFSGVSEMSVGNIVGSNLFNLLVVAGISALLCPPAVDRDILHRDLWWSLAGAALLLIALMDRRISRPEGAVLAAGILIYLFWLIRSALRARREHSNALPVGSDGPATSENGVILSAPRSVFLVLLGLAGVIVGADLVVDSASAIAASLGMDQTLIGLTVVAIGTSLPELVTSVVAALKKDSGLALGNVIGSNIFNIFFILGVSSLIRPITGDPNLWIDLALLMAATVSVFVFCAKKKRLSRPLGGVFLAAYAFYAVYIVLRGTGRL